MGIDRRRAIVVAVVAGVVVAPLGLLLVGARQVEGRQLGGGTSPGSASRQPLRPPPRSR